MAFFLDHNEFFQYELVFIFRLILALLLGGLIGIEREHKNHSAGFRTHILVTLGSCIFMMVSLSMPIIIASMPEGIVNNADPGRIAAQVVSGIGFLGAGAIIQAKGHVRGLTTAASLWVVSAIGLAVGAGLYLTSITATILLFVILTWFSKLELKAALLLRKQKEEKARQERLALEASEKNVDETAQSSKEDQMIYSAENRYKKG